MPHVCLPVPIVHPQRAKEKASRAQQLEAPASISGLGETSSHAGIPSVTDSINSTHIHGSDINIVDVEYANHMYQHGTKSAINTLKKADLVNICVVRFVRPKAEYETLKKPQLLDIVHAQVSLLIACGYRFIYC